MTNSVTISNESFKSFENLNKLQQYVTGRDPLFPRLEPDPPIILELGRLLNAAIGEEEFSKEYRTEFSLDSSNRPAEGLLTMLFHVEMYHRLNLFLLSGEYLKILRKPEQLFDGNGKSVAYNNWLPQYVNSFAVSNTIEDLKKILIRKPVTKNIGFNQKLHDTYFDYEYREKVVGWIIDDNLIELLSSIESHYHFTQTEGRVKTSTRKSYLKRFQDAEYPFHPLMTLLFLNLGITLEDHFLSAESKCLARLINYRDQLRSLMAMDRKGTLVSLTSLSPALQRETLAIDCKLNPLFSDSAKDVFLIFHDKECVSPFYSKFNDILSEKFTPIVQGLYDKVNFLIRKLLLKHSQRPVKDHQMKLFDDQHIPLVFLHRRPVEFSYEDYQLGYYLFTWEQRAKYDSFETQTFVEAKNHDITKYKRLLDKPSDDRKFSSSKLPSLDSYHYATRYFRDFEPSCDYLYKIFLCFKNHVYDEALAIRENRLPAPALADSGGGELYDPLNATDWMAVKQMYNYLYNSYLSQKLSGRYEPLPSIIKAKKLIIASRLIQEETKIYSFFPYYKYASYLLNQIKLIVDVNTHEDKPQDAAALYIELRETITTCERYFTLCRKNEYIPVSMPRGECLPYASADKNITNENREKTQQLPVERFYGPDKTSTFWELKSQDLKLNIGSSYALPVNYDEIGRRIDEQKAEVENIALGQVIVLNEKIRGESKNLKEDLFKTFGWFTGIVAFIVGAIFKISSSQHKGTIYGDLLFLASFGLCLLLFLFALFGLAQPKSTAKSRAAFFIRIASFRDITEEGVIYKPRRRLSLNSLVTLVRTLGNYISGGGALWRAITFIIVFIVLIRFFNYQNDAEALLYNEYKDSMVCQAKREIQAYQDSLNKAQVVPDFSFIKGYLKGANDS